MIRLTELEHTGQVVTIKIEGNLTEATLQILAQALLEYGQRGVLQVCLMADGLVSLDRRAVERARAQFPPALAVSFHTSRIALYELLGSCGVEVVLKASGPAAA